ncbi:TPA: GNAT family N-acetyltransferase [Candidatus Dependentiae bacterium]|nr:MAG: hypothetical protein A2Y17_09830 [Clostridiales bacterium GWF2_38_85]HBL98974.1 GNAT family N-acetyltransferase [Candidatus Dependentiae bacterium]
MSTDPLLIEAPIPLRTERLELRPFEPGDGQVLYDAVMETFDQLSEWMSWAQRYETEGLAYAESTARRFNAAFVLREEFHFAIYSKGSLVGDIGLVRPDWKIPSVELGYWCRKSAQGCGLMTEAANALTRYAFECLGFKRLVIICDKENCKSSAIAERLGFDLELAAKGLWCSKPGCMDLRTNCQYVRFDTRGLPPLKVEW